MRKVPFAFQVLIRELRGLPRHQFGKLHACGRDFAFLNQPDHVVGTVEAKHFDLILSIGRGDGLISTHGHHIVSAKDTINLRIGLQNGFHDFQSTALVKIGRLLGNHFQAFKAVDHTVKTFGAIPGIVVP